MFIDETLYNASAVNFYVSGEVDAISPETCYYNEGRLNVILRNYRELFSSHPNILRVDVTDNLEFLLTVGDDGDEEPFDWEEEGWRYRLLTIYSDGRACLRFELEYEGEYADMGVWLC